MVVINEKEYKINDDIRLGTEKLMGKIRNEPKNPKNPKYLEMILKDILIPSPTSSEVFYFRISDIERIFNEFDKSVNKIDSDFKKKLSQ